MSSTLVGPVLLVLLLLATFVLWKLSLWLSVRVAGSGAQGHGSEPSVAGQLRPDATVPMARLGRGRRAPYPLGDRSFSEQVVADDLRPSSRRDEGLPCLATADALAPAARLDVVTLLVR